MNNLTMLSSLIQKFIDEKHLRFEGDTGVANLNTLCSAIGYKKHGFAFGSSLEVFLSDNSGACDAIIQWMGDRNVDEWAENIESELPELAWPDLDDNSDYE